MRPARSRLPSTAIWLGMLVAAAPPARWRPPVLSISGDFPPTSKPA